MIGERLYQIRELFEAALERDPSRRLHFLEQACLGDAELLGEVQKLIEADEQGDTLLDDLLGAQEVLTRFPPPLPIEGRRIGPYRIEREIGRGGMGIVYLASRADGAFRKQFAFKVVQYSLTSDELLVRFRREREILGSLDHANIARLVDAGATEEGLPYYVMEYIEGQPIDRYCDEQRLNITQRTNLFRAVCQAVQYAHQNLVVHRDLKPSNILVTTDGTVKLLDFGIAKFLDHHRQEAVFAATVVGMRLMTPEYASPEQIRGEPIATASDVYTLGVILYELLTGHKPYRLKSGMLHEVERAICEEEPTRPSTVIVRNDQAASLPSTADEISALREGSIARLRRRLSGDLDNILLMALRKEPGRRYPSAEQLDADLGRHLDNLPVIARQDTVLYRTQKFLLRHKLPLAAAAAFLLFLIGSLVITIQLYLNATRAQSVAVHQSRVADAERERAQLQTVLAEREKNNAKHAAEKAQKAQLQAEAERRHALQAAAEARARQLAAQSESLYTQPGRLTLASLLGIESVRRVPLVENRSFLASALPLRDAPEPSWSIRV
jgi:eukaryotic-like serine/threonine-protein kinase